MVSGQWRSVAVLAALVAAVAPRPTVAQETRPATTAPAGPLSVGQYLEQLNSTLLHAPASQERTEAAQRLAEIDLPEAKQILTNALSGGELNTELACARAIADQTSAPDPRWVQPLARLLREHQSEPAARALARYDTEPAAWQALIEFARSRAATNVRAQAIRAMGRIVQKDVAEALIGLLSDGAQDPAIRAAAADALADLSGQRGNDQDAAKWSQWWNQRKGSPPALWRARIIAEQHPALQQNAEDSREQLRAFRQSARTYLQLHYQRQPAEGRPAVLLQYLNDPNPDIRASGAWIVGEAVNLAQPITADVQRRLLALVGDASPEVRIETVRALGHLANPAAPDAMITQLRVEADPEVKIEMCRALSATPNDEPVPELLRLLRDPSARVAVAAATAVRGLAPVIRRNPTLAAQVVRELEKTLDQRTAPPAQGNVDPASDDLRSALVSAIAPLVGFADPRAMFGRLSGLLNQDESPRTRAAALEGLGGLGPVAADTIQQELSVNNEPDPAVRAEAAKALGQTGSTAHAHFLDASAREENESNLEVRRQARAAFQDLLAKMSAPDLNEWAQTFNQRKDTANRIVALKALCKLLEQQKKFADLAVQQQNLGALYMQSKPPNPTQAIPYLQAALNYYQANNGGTQVPTLVRQLMEAWLASGNYAEAVRFAEKQIALDQANQEIVFPAIRNAADTLITKGEQGDKPSFQKAEQLIRAFLDMNMPPLSSIERDQLDEFRKRIPAPATTSPQS